MLLRWSDADFKAASRDGLGEDWPLSYDDLAPFYDQVEQTLGVRGCAENIPNLPDGHFAGKSKLTSAERTFKEKLEARWPDRHAIAWRYAPPNIQRIPQPILTASATGRLTIRTDAVVKRVLTDPGSGRATGVECVNRQSKETFKATGDVVVLCASTIESVRLMLNSASPSHPNGLGNSSGTLGRYFMDQLPNLIMGTVPGRRGFELDDSVAPDPFYGVSGGLYIPRYENVGPRSTAAFKRGFAYQGTIGRLYVPEARPARFAIMGFGEMLPSPANSISLHKTRKDAWGVPIPHISCGPQENDLALLREQVRSIKEMVDAAGLETEFNGSSLGLQEFGRGAFPDADAFSRVIFRRMFTRGMALGAAIHETGGARMGADPATSVLNSYNQCWDAPNVLVTDGSSFPTGGSAGTTLTIMALTLRACEHIARQGAAVRL
jgi:choline dehydrogenase-like flavoprotein